MNNSSSLFFLRANPNVITVSIVAFPIYFVNVEWSFETIFYKLRNLKHLCNLISIPTFVATIFSDKKVEKSFEIFKGSTLRIFPPVKSEIGLKISNLHYYSTIVIIEIDIPFYFAISPTFV